MRDWCSKPLSCQISGVGDLTSDQYLFAFTSLNMTNSDLSHQASALHRQNNFCAALCQLPPEVLGRIFEWAQRETNRYPGEYREPYDVIFGRYPPHRDLSWTRLMATCSYLREVALATCQLWRHIAIPGDQCWQELCVERVQGHPIIMSVHYDAGTFKSSDATAIAKHLPRASAIYFTDASGPMIAEYRKPKSVLELLHLSSETLQFLHLNSAVLHIKDLNLSQGAASALATLVVSVCDVNMSTWPSLPSLRNFHLDIDDMREGPSGSRANTLMRWLNRSPSMEVLSLHFEDYGNSQISMADHHDSFTVKLQLPRLRILRLNFTPLGALKVLTSLTTKPAMGLDVKLTGTITRDSEDTMQQAFTQLALHITEFWNARADLHEFQPLHIAVILHAHGQHRSRFQMRSFSIQQAVKIDNPFCIIRGSIGILSPPLLDQVSILHISGHSDLDRPVNSDGKRISDMLKNLDTLLVDQDGFNIQIDQLREWIHERKFLNRPIRLLQIRVPGNETAQASLERTATQLVQSGMLCDVEWVLPRR